jgi:hypothetical protein
MALVGFLVQHHVQRAKAAGGVSLEGHVSHEGKDKRCDKVRLDWNANPHHRHF